MSRDRDFYPRTTRIIIFGTTVAILLLVRSTNANSTNQLKCSACIAVADELGERLRAERPRNRLDTRHRLDKDGKRYGKVIDFKVSELRAIELLEGLCDGLKKYQLDELESSWVLSIASSGSKEDEQMLKDQRRILKNMCADIIGPIEDELATSIRQGKAEPESIRSFLCTILTRKCTDFRKDDKSEL